MILCVCVWCQANGNSVRAYLFPLPVLTKYILSLCYDEKLRKGKAKKIYTDRHWTPRPPYSTQIILPTPHALPCRGVFSFESHRRGL